MTESRTFPLPLPAPLEGLRSLAMNLRWSWHPESEAVFRRADPALWERSGRNPIRLLRDLGAARLDALAGDAGYVAAVDAAAADLQRHLARPDTWFAREHGAAGLRVAYFSAEFGITECLRIYSGGLGVLAGDHSEVRERPRAAARRRRPLLRRGLLPAGRRRPRPPTRIVPRGRSVLAPADPRP